MALSSAVFANLPTLRLSSRRRCRSTSWCAYVEPASDLLITVLVRLSRWGWLEGSRPQRSSEPNGGARRSSKTPTRRRFLLPTHGKSCISLAVPSPPCGPGGRPSPSLSRHRFPRNHYRLYPIIFIVLLDCSPAGLFNCQVARYAGQRRLAPVLTRRASRHGRWNR